MENMRETWRKIEKFQYVLIQVTKGRRRKRVRKNE